MRIAVRNALERHETLRWVAVLGAGANPRYDRRNAHPTMATRCPQCDDVLKTERFMEMPPDGSSDEVTLSLLRCPSCGRVGLGIYEESRRGALGEDHWRYHAYETTQRSWDELDALVRACPNPRYPLCDCASHQALAKLDAGGRWAGVDRHLGKHLG